MYKEVFDFAMKQIHDEMAAAGKEDDFTLFFNIEYLEDTISEIKVAVASEFMWNTMNMKGNIKKIESIIQTAMGQKNIKLVHVVKSVPESHTSLNDIYNQTKTSNVPSSEKNSIPAENSQNSKSTETKKHPQLLEEYTFDNFVPGDNSDYAYSACLAAAKSPGHKNYNPILLYGPSGVGKTHLMVAIGNYIYSQDSSLKIAYTTTESLMNEFTTAIREKSTDKFTKKYRKLDVLLLDDIQFLEKSEKLQDELFFTYEEIFKRKGQLVFTCDRPIKEISGIQERLSSRFKNGPNIDLKAPNYETRLAIIDKKLELQGKDIAAEVKEFIAKNIQSNVRDLEGALSKMIAYAELMHKTLTLDIAKEQLSDSISTNENGIITVETIQKVVSNYYNVSVSDLKGDARKKTVLTPRHIAIYLSRKLTEYSLMEIGDEFGGRDHTTIMNSIKKIEENLKIGDNMIADTLRILEKQIKEFN